MSLRVLLNHEKKLIFLALIITEIYSKEKLAIFYMSRVIIAQNNTAHDVLGMKFHRL